MITVLEAESMLGIKRGEMENCGIYETDTRLLSSLTVRLEEIRALELPAGRVLYCKGEPLSYGYDAVLIVDRFAADDGRLACTMVRQVLPCSDGEWGQDHILPHKAAREWARDSGARPLLQIHQR